MFVKERLTACRRAQRGISLLEALVALVVMSFGMLALGALQLNLSRSADVAKQRSEALRIAEERVELARSFTSMTTSGGVDWANLQSDVASPTTVATNATYTVTVTVGGAVSDSSRPINVQVAWTDRAGEAQMVSLSSVISRTDPRDPGFLGNPLPLNKPLKRPKNRNINIPIPAVELGGGKSATQFDANYVVVFSNLTANIVQICNPNQGNATAAQINAAIASGTACVSYNGYIIAGYVGRDSGAIVWPTGINFSQITRNTAPSGPSSGIRCRWVDATNVNTGATITANNGYKYYICVIPLDPPSSWSGTVRLGGISTAGTTIVCRYEYTQTTVTSNERNVQPYSNVDMSLDEQNYLIATTTDNTNASLAGTTGVCPSSMTVAGVSRGVVHQDCRGARNPNAATECPAASP